MQVTYWCWLKMELQRIIFCAFFLKSWNPFSNLSIKMASMAAYSSLFTGLCSANVSKWMKLFAIIQTCYNLNFISNMVIIWNVAQIRWFSPCRCMFNSFKWVVKSTTMLNLWALWIFTFWHKFPFWFHKGLDVTLQAIESF